MMRSMTRAAIVAVLSGLLATSAFAAAPLPAGKPAGVKEANLAGPGLLWIGVAGIIAVTIAVVASSNDDGVTTPTTTATGTTP